MNTGKQHHRGKKSDHKSRLDHKEKAEAENKSEEMVKIPKAELEKLKKAAAADSEYKEKMLRTMAEMENLRKRLDRDRKEYVNYANREMIGDLLPVLDNFDRALKSVEKTEDPLPFCRGSK